MRQKRGEEGNEGKKGLMQMARKNEGRMKRIEESLICGGSLSFCLLMHMRRGSRKPMTSFTHSLKIPNNKEVIIGASNQNGQMLSVGSFSNTIELVR